MPNGSVDDSELLRIAIREALASIAGPMPGRVDSYDASAGTATITPMLTRPVPTADGGAQYEPLPQIYSVKVIHPGGEDWALHIPLKQGDSVLLVPLKWDPSPWEPQGQRSNPRDRRMFSIAHAIAFAGYRPNNKPIAGASADYPTWQHKDGFQVTLKSNALEVGGASDAAALASKVDDLANIVNNHVHPYTWTGSAGSGSTSVLASPYTGGPSGSTKLKVGG